MAVHHVVAGSMPILLAVFWDLPRVGLDLRFFYTIASPRFSVELPASEEPYLVTNIHIAGRCQKGIDNLFYP